jgi:hypothetical protein
MGPKRQSARIAQPWKTLLTLLCALVLLVGCTVQVAHTHADGTANHADCSLCMAVHAGVQVSAAPAVVPAAVAVSRLVEAAPARAPGFAFSTFALFTRPPPASVSAA